MTNPPDHSSWAAADFAAYAFRSLAPSQDEGDVVEIACHYLNNPDGSVRWIWPAASRRPEFLRFYHAGSWRARLFARLMRWSFKLGLQQLLSSGSCRVAISSKAMEQLADHSAWALFTGTIGPNRKMVLWHLDAKKDSLFVKLALGEKASGILRQEQWALQQMEERSYTHVQIPAVVYTCENGFAQRDVAAATETAGNHMQCWPQKAWQEWLSTGITQKTLADTDFYQQCLRLLHDCKDNKDARIPALFMDKVQLLLHRLDASKKVQVAPAHGDCTPWNTRMGHDHVAMIDWELYRHEAPALFDFFHYEYQSGVMLGNRGFTAIRTNIDAQLKSDCLQQVVHGQGLDASTLEQLYLLSNILFYLDLYCRQDHWHQQVYWLLDTWNDAISYWLYQRHCVSARDLLLHDVSIFLHNKPHAAMKFLEPHLLQLSEESDLDLCTTKTGAKELEAYIESHVSVQHLLTSRRSNMMQMTALLHDGSMLHMDAIWQFKRRDIDFLNAGHVLQTAAPSACGLRLPLSLYDFLYTWLFYFLNDAPVPARYIQQWQSMKSIDRAFLFNYLEESTGMSVGSLEALYHPSAETANAVRKWITKRQPNTGAQKLANQLLYIMDSFRSFFKRHGMLVTFSGVDGAGKSTVIEATRQRIEKGLRRPVVVLRHRPSLLPILSAWKYGKEQAEHKAAATLPRQGNNKSTIGSLVRFAYYYSDYVFGQFYIYVKYVMRGYIVLYDRYYFDFINDSVRSNIRLPRAWTSKGYCLLMKPRLNFFLYASANEILARKQELSAETIERLTADYLQLFGKLTQRYKHSQYLPVHNSRLDQTLQFIVGQIKATA